jgi:hypothetical protein
MSGYVKPVMTGLSLLTVVPPAAFTENKFLSLKGVIYAKVV